MKRPNPLPPDQMTPAERRDVRRDNLDATSATIRMRERRRWRTEGRA